MNTSLYKTFALSLAAITVTTSTAYATDAALYETNNPDAPLMVVSDQGIIFLHKDGTPYRAYKVSKNTKLHVTELNQDGKPDIIGIGKPTFAIGGDADTQWFDAKGCRYGALADIVADSKLDLACNTGKELKVLTYDNQFVWSLSIGRPLKQCYAGDTNGDQKAEVECKTSGKKYARFESTGKLIDANISEPMIDQEGVAYDPTTPLDASVFESKQTFDFDLDGTPEEYILMDDKLLVIKSKSRPKPLAMLELDAAPKALFINDMDGDKVQEVVALTDKKLYLLSVDGKRNASYSLKASSYKRKPLADLQSVYANGFADNEAAKKAITDVQDKLSSCYAGQLKKTQFAGSGKMLIQLKVDQDGKLTNTDLMHSEIADKKVGQCAIKNLKKASFPKASADSASINLTIYYTFRDN